jgi:hypothetical protein
MRLDTDLLLSLAIPLWGCAQGIIALRKHDKRQAWQLLVPAGLMLGFIFIVLALGLDNVPPQFRTVAVTEGEQEHPEASGAAALSPNSLDALLKAEADKVNKSAPHMLDEETRLDGALAGPGKRFTYLYTLPGLAPGEAGAGFFNRMLAPKVKRSACVSPQLRFFFNNNVTVVYLYRSSNGNDLGSILISRSACRPKPAVTASAPSSNEASPPQEQENSAPSSSEPENLSAPPERSSSEAQP